MSFLSRGKRLMPHAAQQLLSQRLPDAPDPECRSCSAALNDVRHFHVEPAGAGVFRVSCLSKCTRCGARHIGFRSVGVDGRRTRFLLQEFELYSETEHGQDLKKVADQIVKKREKFDEIQARPVVDAP